MLVWSKKGRSAVWFCVVPLFLLFYGLPIAIIGLASVSGQWNGMLPSTLTLMHYANAFKGASFDSMIVSIVTGALASAAALICGTWAAVALRHAGFVTKRVLDVFFFVPSAVPSVSVGLAMLVAFSGPPLVLNGTSMIVFVAHFVLISAFTYGNVTAGLARVPLDCEQVAESLGARPFYRLRRVTLPLLMPYLVAAFSLSFALSMGELGATVMIYPPGWTTLPVSIFALSDRGAIFDAATLTVLLGMATLIVLLLLSKLSTRAMMR